MKNSFRQVLLCILASCFAVGFFSCKKHYSIDGTWVRTSQRQVSYTNQHISYDTTILNDGFTYIFRSDGEFATMVPATGQSDSGAYIVSGSTLGLILSLGDTIHQDIANLSANSLSLNWKNSNDPNQYVEVYSTYTKK